MKQEFESLFDMMQVFKDEQTCIDHLRAIRWRQGEFCPLCGSTRVYHFSDKRTHKCGDCRQRFSIKVGTIFEDTKLPLRKWFMAIWLIASHKKGIASTALAMNLKVTQKTAWFVLHRLRYAARAKSFNKPLKREIEIDETFLGGKGRNKHASSIPIFISTNLLGAIIGGTMMKTPRQFAASASRRPLDLYKAQIK